MTPKPLPTVRIFAPEMWGQVDFFSNLSDSTYKFDEREQRALAGVTQHFQKAGRFQSDAIRIRPNLALDRAQLNERGFTPAENSKELAIAVEAAIQEVYSSVDCTAKVLRAVFGKTSRGFKDSTRNLFKNFETIEGMPVAIKDILRAASWYEDLRFLRDELTHLGTGTCSLADKTDVVSYMHLGIKTNGKRHQTRGLR